VSVAIGSDELWLGVICQSNSVIAGSPRNMFWHRPRLKVVGVKILKRDRARKRTASYQTLNTTITCPSDKKYLGLSSLVANPKDERGTTQTIS